MREGGILFLLEGVPFSGSPIELVEWLHVYVYVVEWNGARRSVHEFCYKLVGHALSLEGSGCSSDRRDDDAPAGWEENEPWFWLGCTCWSDAAPDRLLGFHTGRQ